MTEFHNLWRVVFERIFFNGLLRLSYQAEISGFFTMLLQRLRAYDGGFATCRFQMGVISKSSLHPCCHALAERPLFCWDTFNIYIFWTQKNAFVPVTSARQLFILISLFWSSEIAKLQRFIIFGVLFMVFTSLVYTFLAVSTCFATLSRFLLTSPTKKPQTI